MGNSEDEAFLDHILLKRNMSAKTKLLMELLALFQNYERLFFNPLALHIRFKTNIAIYCYFKKHIKKPRLVLIKRGSTLIIDSRIKAPILLALCIIELAL
tara:strand:+ start:107 stop:406 length:300 start_codon:yes stop_codon:yes gene_type:complete